MSIVQFAQSVSEMFRQDGKRCRLSDTLSSMQFSCTRLSHWLDQEKVITKRVVDQTLVRHFMRFPFEIPLFVIHVESL